MRDAILYLLCFSARESAACFLIASAGMRAGMPRETEGECRRSRARRSLRWCRTRARTARPSSTCSSIGRESERERRRDRGRERGRQGEEEGERAEEKRRTREETKRRAERGEEGEGEGIRTMIGRGESREEEKRRKNDQCDGENFAPKLANHRISSI